MDGKARSDLLWAEITRTVERLLTRTQAAVTSLVIALAQRDKEAVARALLMAQAAHFFHDLHYLHHSAPDAERANRLLDAANDFLDWQALVLDDVALQIQNDIMPSASDVAQRLEDDAGRKQAILDAIG